MTDDEALAEVKVTQVVALDASLEAFVQRSRQLNRRWTKILQCLARRAAELGIDVDR